MLKYGIDHIGEYRKDLADARVALLTNITGRNSQLQSDISILNEMSHLTALFGPEHGVRGNIGAGDPVAQSVDPQTGVPVYSLYGENGRHFTEEMLDQFDVLIYDIQDVGVRFFTYLSTLRNAMRDCAASGKKLIVLDRPNPLGGEVVEGNILKDAFKSFVGCCNFPYRYGLTAGEAALMLNKEEAIGCDLQVIECSGWKRSMLYPQWGKIWVAPSPALMNYESVLVYPGMCLLEGTNLSEGRGTSAPFRVMGADFIDAEDLSEKLNREKLPGVITTPVWFIPSASKFEGKPCAGVVLHVTDAAAFRPVTFGITLLDWIRRDYGDKFKILPPIEGRNIPMLALISGDDALLGDWDKDALLQSYVTDSEAFAKKKQAYHLYD